MVVCGFLVAAAYITYAWAQALDKFGQGADRWVAVLDHFRRVQEAHRDRLEKRRTAALSLRVMPATQLPASASTEPEFFDVGCTLRPGLTIIAAASGQAIASGTATLN